jgi:hypothetical protein
MNALVPILLINAAVTLIAGAALLLAWRRTASLRFSRDLGWAFVAQAFAPAAFLLWRTGTAAWQLLGGALLIVCAVVISVR